MATRSTTPLVDLVSKEDAPPEVRAVFEGGEAQYGRILHTWQALAQRPEIFVAYLPYLRSIVGPGALEQRTKELVEVRTVVLNRCLYSTSHRVRSAKAAGVPEDDLVARVVARSLAWAHRLVFRAALEGLVAGRPRAELAAELRVQADRAYDQLGQGLAGYGVKAV